MAKQKETYSVEVIGFSQTELMALASVFELSSRRVPKFARHTVAGTPPDILLVDANDMEAVRILLERNAVRPYPDNPDWRLEPRNQLAGVTASNSLDETVPGIRCGGCFAFSRGASETG